MSEPATSEGTVPISVRRMAQNFCWLLADRGARLASGLVVGILVARHLGPADYGRLSYALSLLTLLVCLPTLGLDTTVKREFVSQPERARELLSTVLAARIMATCACALLLALLLPFLPAGERLVVLAGAGTLLMPVASTFDLWFEARLHGRRGFAARMLPTLGSAALRLALLAADASVTAFAVAASIEALLMLGSLGWAAHRVGMTSSARLFSRTLARDLLRESWPLLLASGAVTVYSRCDQIMLRHFGGEAMVGTYAAVARFTELAALVPILLASTAYPWLIESQRSAAASFHGRVQRFYDLNAGLAYGIAIIFSVGAPWLVRVIYGASFAPAAPILAVHIWSLVFIYVGVARSHVLTIEGRTTIQMVSALAGAGVNVALNAWLIPRWGGLGAAWATVAAQAAAVWLVLLVTRQSWRQFWQVGSALAIPVTGWRYLRPELRPAQT